MNIRFKAEYADPQLIYNHCIKTEQTAKDYRPHFHDAYEILFLREGRITYLIGGEQVPLRKHSLVLTRPGQRHSIRVEADVPYDRYNLQFAAEAMSPELLGRIPDRLDVMGFEANALVIGLFERMDFYCDKLSSDTLGRILRNLTEELLANVLIQLNVPNGADSRRNPLTLRALAYIEENLLSIPDVEALCSELSVSRSYLHQLFQQDLGTSPKHYITVRRLETARREISLGAKATAVCGACGFPDYSTFFRAYKKHFGYSPAATRQAVARIAHQDTLRGHIAE